MAHYVVLLNWTEQGVTNAQATVDRVQQARAAFEPLKVMIDQVFWTIGRYDIVAMAQAPDDETMSAAMLKLAASGNVRTETLRAFDEQTMRQILQKLG